MDNTWFEAAIWMALALAASVVSIRLALPVALIEILAGILGGNLFGLHTGPWIDFLSLFGAGILTFLAGAEIDPVSFRRLLKPSLAVGLGSFLCPFAGAMAFAYFVAGWDIRGAEIAGLALSTTSVAVVYAAIVETGLNQTDFGKLILAAVFVTDLSTVVALGILFANFNLWMVAFVAVTAVLLWYLPRWMRWLLANWQGSMSGPEVKFIFLVLFFLGGLSTTAKSEAILPAYLVGLVLAGVFLHDKKVVQQLQTIAFGVLTPFFFIKAGLFVSVRDLILSMGPIAALVSIKVAMKFVGIWPLTRAFGLSSRESTYMSLIMSTGLMFGSIAALYGLTNGIIDQTQYTILVTGVIASAVVPTPIAQFFFLPRRKSFASRADVGPEPPAEPLVGGLPG